MFKGIHNINLDTKGRLAIPTKYRESINNQVNGNMVITIDTEEKCLLLYTLQIWNEIQKRINNLPSFNKNARRIQRLLVGHAEDVIMDNNGRILISRPLRNSADLVKKVTLIGQGDKFEIWNDELWQSQVSRWKTEETDETEETVLGDIRI
ncbi:MAG: cell division/cell wall cluster transcriptional repressor MraZ [Gammaproteobacteria bacterium]|nr:cell division/cell wall cluster transcriptional repressor MraZ [Gammaproteobacteria bacterium]